MSRAPTDHGRCRDRRRCQRARSESPAKRPRGWRGVGWGDSAPGEPACSPGGRGPAGGRSGRTQALRGLCRCPSPVCPYACLFCRTRTEPKSKARNQSVKLVTWFNRNHFTSCVPDCGTHDGSPRRTLSAVDVCVDTSVPGPWAPGHPRAGHSRDQWPRRAWPASPCPVYLEVTPGTRVPPALPRPS